MISVSHLYTNNQESLEEFVGTALVIGGGIALLGLIMAISEKKVLSELEDSLINVYSNDYLAMKIDVNQERINKSIFDKLTLSGRFKNKILSENGVSLIVNKKTAVYIKQKFGRYPMFEIIGTNRSYEVDYNKFVKDHHRLFKGFFSNKLEQAIGNERLADEIRINLGWLTEALKPFLFTNEITENSVKKVKVQAKKFQTLSIERE